MKYMNLRPAALGLALLIGLSACDLEVVNPNAPDAQRALQTAGDVETLIAGSFGQWWFSVHHPSGPAHVFANKSFQWSAWPANFGMFFYSQLPRVAIVNDPTNQFYDNVVNGVWFRAYRCLSAVAQGMDALDDPEIADALGAASVLRARAFGKLMQGLCHGSLALFYESAWILDEDTEVVDEAGLPIQQDPVPYTDVMDVALQKFDDAVALSSGATFTIPSGWITNRTVTAADLALVASSMKARYRANVARTPAQRADVSQGGIVDWGAVIDEVDAGVNGDWTVSVQVFEAPFWHDMLGRSALSWIGWNQESYMINGMADQSGRYQEWLSVSPAESRHPDLASGPFIIVTPDQRFPQGATLDEQRDDNDRAGLLRQADALGGNNWGQAARGTHRWSYYRSTIGDAHWFDEQEDVPEITEVEMRLLRAEGMLRLGDAAGAAALINVTRVGDGGLSPADLVGTNLDCVPRLPSPGAGSDVAPNDDQCGGLLEMLKWEKRLYTANLGVHSNTWYFDGRGWGDLYLGTALELPFPCLDAELMFQPCTATGGMGGPMASTGSIYGLEP